MMTALGASAYAAGVYHLMTHAFFKALLFLAAGSVIIGMHHDQDIRNMGGIRKYMPYTWITALLGSLALIGFPGFSGFFSKDAIIEAVHLSDLAVSGYAYWMLFLGVFVTALYSFRMYFLVFHGQGPRDEHAKEHLHESPKVVWVPLVLLAIPSVIIGWPTVGPMLFGDWFSSSIHVLPQHDVLGEMGKGFHGAWGFLLHGLGLVTVLAIGGAVVAWFIYMKRPDIADMIKQKAGPLYRLLDKKYWVDEIYQALFAGGSRGLGKMLWNYGDKGLIDGVIINGSARNIGRFAGFMRSIQSGYLFHYAIAMILGLLVLLAWFVLFK
jgi:NADH-quinone oxidoreductase subunit L